MIGFGLRLTLNGGREAAARLVITAAAVAIGVSLLLMTSAGINAVNSQNARYAWLATTAEPDSANAAGTDPLWGMLSTDYFRGQIITRADLAATGPSSPVPPGIPHLPGPGQYYASPAMARLLRATPPAQLADRYPARQIGTIGRTALPAPNSLIIVIGRTVAQLAHQPGAAEVRSINTTVPSSCEKCQAGVGINANGVDLILSVISLALLFPVLIFIAAATRLSAARREQRFAAMRLVGATPRQIAVIATVDSAVAAVAGMLAGFGLFFLLRPVMASFSFTGAPFFASDLALNLADVLAVAIGVPVAAALVARLALRRVQISPLGVSRRVTPRPPRAYRLIPMLLGLGELSYFLVAAHPDTGSGQVRAYLPGFLLIMAGLVIAGPWLTMLCARSLARRTGRADMLIAGRRLADNPQAGFRAISGLVLALFVASVSVGVITTFVAYRGVPHGDAAAAGTLVRSYGNDVETSGHRPSAVASVPAAVLRELGSIRGVRGVTLIHLTPGTPLDAVDTYPAGLVSCAELARTPAFGRCPPGAAAVTVDSNFGGSARTVWPPAAISAAQLRALPVETIVVGTDGSSSAIERSRTVLEVAEPLLRAPGTIDEFNAENSRQTAQYQQLANVVILFSLLIAGCSLAVSVAGGISERKRPFSLLRLAGMPLGMLRRVVALESVAPLLLSAMVAVGAGFVAAQIFLRAQLGYSLRAPAIEYYLVVGAGLLVSLGIIASTFPLLERVTGPETARND